MNPLQITQLLITFFICTIGSFLLCGAAKALFPTFRSGEHKPGTHRSDMPVSGREIKNIELPQVGGPAFILAIIGTGIASGFIFQFHRDQWILLFISLGVTLGFGIVGFIDDWRKVYSNQGLSEVGKFSGLFLVAVSAAVCYFFLLPAGRESYSFWKDLPILGNFLCNEHTIRQTCDVFYPQVAFFGWLVFLVLLVSFTGTATAVAVDFSDGFDGLSSGLVFSAALALGIAVTGLIEHEDGGIVLEILALICAGAALGYLPWNWPSSWAARRNASVKRRAQIYMGDSGALALGGLLAMVALFSRNEFLLLTTIGGVFVLEALSVIVSARLLAPFFRRRLQILRFANTEQFVPHTEFPLPFLATPLHHHFDLLGWDRKRLVYSAWALGAIFAVLSVMVSVSDTTWQRYLGRFLALLLMALIWSSGTWSKCYFVGTLPSENKRHNRLALFYGYPYILMGIRLYHHVETIMASADKIETPAEDLALWQRMTIYDARSMLGLYCYRSNYLSAAHAQWSRIPDRNRVLRPEIQHLWQEVETRLALEKQETQPMRRDEILRPQKPILTGNLPPADLPNPFEPISQEEVEDSAKSPWSELVPDVDEEEQTTTQPLKNNL